MKRRRRKKQRSLIIISSLTLLFIMTVGYAAFQTNLNINVKGNIKDYNAAWQLKKKIISSGDGLYADGYESGRYVYKGENPDNYIAFNNEIWRIMAIEKDDVLKIVRQQSIGPIAFDPKNNRSSSTNTYCNLSSTGGCNAWNIKSGIYTVGSSSGTVTQDSYLNTYLNTTFYNSILADDKKYILIHDFYLGAVNHKISLQEIIQAEKKETWNGKIGLYSVGDYYRASNNSSCQSTTNDYCPSSTADYIHENFKCSLNNYVYNNEPSWTMTPLIQSNSQALTGIQACGCYGWSSAFLDNKIFARPTLFLIPDIKLSGKGTQDNPYTIN